MVGLVVTALVRLHAPAYISTRTFEHCSCSPINNKLKMLVKY